MINNPKLQLSSSKILNIDINIANFQLEDIKQFSSLKILNILNFFWQHQQVISSKSYIAKLSNFGRWLLDIRLTWNWSNIFSAY